MKREEAARLLHAHLDGELDATTSLAVEACISADPELKTAFERLRDLSTGIKEGADYHRAPQHLRDRVSQSMRATPGVMDSLAAVVPVKWRAWSLVTAGALLIALLASGATFWWLGSAADRQLTEEVLASHVRSVLGNRLIDVASSDQHTVKPWLSGRLNFSPPVSDFVAQGFELVGARVDYIDGQMVAAMVYRRRQHVIDVYVWPTTFDRGLRTDMRRGFNLQHFSNAGMNYWLVSDLNPAEMSELTRLLEVQSSARS